MKVNSLQIKITISIFLLILYCPVLLTGLEALTGKKVDVELKGYFDSVAYPIPSLDAFKNGQYQNDFSKWFDQRFDPHGLLMKGYNTIQYNCFKLGNGGRILGKDNDIFEMDYINAELCLDDYNNYNLPERKEELKEYVGQLQAIKGKLNAVGKELLVYVTPSKAHYHYANIPYKYLQAAPQDGIRCVDAFTDLIDSTNIPFFNSEDIGRSLETPAFYSSGIHWSRTYEQLVNHTIINKLAALTDKQYQSYKIESLETNSLPYRRDSDVYDLMNVFNPIGVDAFYQYETSIDYPEKYDKMHILLQGGSFADGLRTDILENYPNEGITYINYCNYIIDNVGNYETLNSDWANLNLQPLLDSADCVVIEINEAVMHRYSDGFVKYLNDFLDTYIPSDVVIPAMKKLDIADPAAWNEKAMTGFYGREAEMVWINKCAEINIEDPDIQDKGLNISLNVPKELFHEPGEQHIYVYVNGLQVYDRVFTEASQENIYITADALKECKVKNDRYTVMLLSTKSFVPKKLNMGDDNRELAVQIYYIGAGS